VLTDAQSKHEEHIMSKRFVGQRSMIRAAVQFTSLTLSKCQRRLRTFGISSLPPIGRPGILTCRMFASRTVPAVSGRGFHILSARISRLQSRNSCRMSGSPGTREELVCTLTTWLIIPTPNGCCVLTEETQRSAFIQGVYAQLMSNSNQKWLEALAVRFSNPAKPDPPDVLT